MLDEIIKGELHALIGTKKKRMSCLFDEAWEEAKQVNDTKRMKKILRIMSDLQKKIREMLKNQYQSNLPLLREKEREKLT